MSYRSDRSTKLPLAALVAVLATLPACAGSTPSPNTGGGPAMTERAIGGDVAAPDSATAGRVGGSIQPADPAAAPPTASSPQAGTPQAGTPASQPGAPMPAAGATSPAATRPAAGNVAELFRDANIAAVAGASNQSEIVPSRLALEKTQHAELRAYAQRMIDEHARLDAQMQQLLQRKGLAPEHNALSHQLEANLRPMMAELEAANGMRFDQLYLNHMIGSHMTTLHALDTSLIPSARDPEMRQMLERQVRPAVAQHYDQALRLQAAMLGAGGR